jgi:tripartite-type tricarboxylate transporter receptor subunit TctC
MMAKFTKALALACALGSALTADPVSAQQFPSKTITIVVGYSAGGQADALARAVANRLSEALKVAVVVENKPGANGLLAAQSVANARPDGHTILLVTDAMLTIDPQLPGSAKWDPSAHLEPVVNMAMAPLFIAAHKDVPADAIPALVEHGKKNPNSLSFGTSGNATPHRLTGEMLQKLGGFQMKHVPYRGTAASLTDLLGGQITLVIGSSTALEPQAKAGKIKFLGVTTEQRFPLLPDVPAIAETYPGFNVDIYFGIMAPKRTPAPVIATLNASINKVLSSPEARESLEKLGVVPAGGTPVEFKTKVTADVESRGKLIRELEIKAD